MPKPPLPADVARRARLAWIRDRPRVSLTALKEDEWYTHVRGWGGAKAG